MNQPAVSGTEVFRVCTNVFMHFYNSAGRLQGLKAHLSHLYLQGLLGWAGLGPHRHRPTRLLLLLLLLLQPLMADI